jgi:outer membrane immunogenic protein
MRSVILALAVSGALLGVRGAGAADMPVKAVPPAAVVAANWTGLYVGAAGGVGWGRTNHTDLNPPVAFDRGPWGISGGIVGGTVGYNWQMGHAVLGVEGDGSWAHIHKDFQGVNCNSGLCFTDVQSLGTVRGRLGYAANDLLVFATAGAAVAGVRAGIYGCTPECIDDKTRWGWTVGGGFEWFFVRNWSAKVEYLYADFGNKVNYFTGFNNTVRLNTSLLRAGINYHFTAP